LDYFNKLAQNPEIGVAGAIYEALKQKDTWDQKHFGKEFEERFSQIEQTFQESEQRRETEAAMARTFTAAKSLVDEFPELDDGNHSEAAEEAQAAIIQMIQSVPQGPQWLKHNPEQALRWAAMEYRRTNGTPVFAVPPGTSESPSARVAAAAEKRSAGGETLDGSGVPKSKQGGKPASLADKWREDSNRLKGREATSPSGRRLGFPA